MIKALNIRFLTSFGMTGSFVESKGRSGDSQGFFLTFMNTGANRRFFPGCLTNQLSFRALARNLCFINNHYLLSI